MSAMVETPNPLADDHLVSSFYVPPVQEDESTIFSFHAGIEQMRFSKKNHAEGYRCIVKQTKKDKTGKAPLLEYFITKNVIGHPIRNARTGYLYTQYRVGQINECLFFKIRLCTEESHEAQEFSMRQQLSNKDKIITYDKPDPDVLFYDSPEEYETHFQISLSQELKDQWRTCYERLLRHLEKTKRNQSQNQDSHIKILSTKPTTAPPPPGLSTSGTTKFRPPSPDCPPPGYEVNTA